jgi:5-carboxymethyl-2-hydroxymuconate isomerase
MPHILIDYSANLDADFDIRDLANAVHERALATGVFPVGGTRTRVERREIYVIGDGHPENRYIHVQARIGIGRPPDVRQKVAEDIFSVVKDFTAATFAGKPLGLTLEIVEIDPVGALRHNNLHEIIAARQAKTSGETKTAGEGN